AWADLVNDYSPGGRGAGGSEVRELLANVQGGDLAEELQKEFERELFHEALARVQPQISLRDWKLFNDHAFAGRRLTDLPAEHHLSTAAAGMAIYRVREKLQSEVTRLQGGE